MATEDRLTILYDLLQAMDKAGKEVKEKHEEDYKKIIEYVKTSETKERILAATILAKFFKHFPEYEETAFDSIVDLCESADVDVRKRATMELVNICRDRTSLVSKAADILIQLYQTNQASEVNLINQSLTTLLRYNISMFLQSFFTNFEDGSESVRERALKLLSTKLPTVSEDALTKEVEEQLLAYSTKAMEDVTKDEFMTFIGILCKLKVAKTASGQQKIVSVIKTQADMTKDFDVNDTDAIDKFLLCTQQTIPFLSQYNRASEYINYICLKVLPHLEALVASARDLSLLRALAEMSPFIIAEDIPEKIDIDKCQEAVFTKLLEYLPVPDAEQVAPKAAEPVAESSEKKEETEKKPEEPPTGAEADAVAGDGSEKKPVEKPKEADFQFTHIEYLLYTFHQLGRHKEYLNDTTLTPDVTKRLLNLSNGCTRYMSALDSQLARVKGQDLNKEENKIRLVALRTTKNISLLVKDLLKKSYKSTITLSCKPAPPAAVVSQSGQNNANNNGKRPNQQSNNGNQQKGGNFQRFGGQKNKYRGNFQGGNKRPRYAR